ncbi:nucleotidyl transferase AbiEii/AbiGii toxin family protein [Acinetobacter modestus]|uniref:nucleotidyl transferase AbiEii/AbiGii toxin family protein n=1 Tax=Acinetobacter modestus TaxID=1776740 RepID=UPI00320B07F6
MLDLNEVFLEVADALNIEATSIIEKDYYVVELLRLLQPLKFETHDLVFAGGTALAKANIQLNRMSEDVDIKIVPKPNVELSRSKAKSIRKQLNQQLQEIISNLTKHHVYDLLLNWRCWKQIYLKHQSLDRLLHWSMT